MAAVRLSLSSGECLPYSSQDSDDSRLPSFLAFMRELSDHGSRMICGKIVVGNASLAASRSHETIDVVLAELPGLPNSCSGIHRRRKIRHES